MLGRDLTDSLRDLIRALGHDERGAHSLLVIAQRDREVRRVHDHDIGLRHLLHHAAPGKLLLCTCGRGL